jgi:ABC-type glycerol-3-phosphate transport system substrate-binding protein
MRFKYMPHMEVVYWGPNTSEGQKVFTAEYDLALLGKKPVDQAMKDAAKQLDNVLKEG